MRDNQKPLSPLSSFYFRYFLMATFLTLPFLAQIFARLFGKEVFDLPFPLQVGLSTVLQFGCGWIVYQSAFRSLRMGKLNLDCLIGLGITISYFYSLVVYLLNKALPLFFETHSLILTLTLFGKWLEAFNERQASEWIPLIETAENLHIPLHRLIDQTAGSFTIAVLGISLLTWLGWGWLIEDYVFAWVYASDVIIAACPAAASLAIPIVLLVTTGLAERDQILSNKLPDIRAKALFQVTMSKIRQSLLLAFAFNALTIPIAVMGLLNPNIAFGTIAMSSIAVIANAMLLYYWDPQK
jgi:cation transport ATPase